MTSQGVSPQPGCGAEDTDMDKTTKCPAAGVQLDPSPAQENQAATPLLFQGQEPQLCLQTPARSPAGAMLFL